MKTTNSHLSFTVIEARPVGHGIQNDTSRWYAWYAARLLWRLNMRASTSRITCSTHALVCNMQDLYCMQMGDWIVRVLTEECCT